MQRGNLHLNGLRAFEAAARSRSLLAAGDELHVTPSAVGHQIRALEKSLGVRLFDRQSKRLVLTKTGERFASMLKEGFDLIERATASVRRETAQRPIAVSATPAMALKWLAPALDQLRQEGFAEFRIDASSREADLASGEADLDIRYGRNVEPGLVADVLFSESVFPVCSSDYASALVLEKPADLLRANLLFVDDWGSRGGVWSSWKDWFELTGLETNLLREAKRFTEMDKAVKAAARGEGVALGAARHLSVDAGGEDASKLVSLFEGRFEIKYSSFLVALPEIAEERTIRLLRRRLIKMAHNSGGVLNVGAF